MLTGNRPNYNNDEIEEYGGFAVNFRGAQGDEESVKAKAEENNLDAETSDLSRLTDAWINERFCPEVLPYCEVLVNNVSELIKAQTVNIKEQKMHEDVDIAFKLVLYQQEIERAKYVLRSYLRTRIAKLEAQALFIVEAQAMKQRLSLLEQEYLEAYSAIIESHLTESCLNSLPKPLQNLKEQNEQVKMIPEPDLDRGVFVKVLEDIGSIETVRGESVYLAKNDIHLLRYRYIQQFLLEDVFNYEKKVLKLI